MTETLVTAALDGNHLAIQEIARSNVDGPSGPSIANAGQVAIRNHTQIPINRRW